MTIVWSQLALYPAVLSFESWMTEETGAEWAVRTAMGFLRMEEAMGLSLRFLEMLRVEGV